MECAICEARPAPISDFAGPNKRCDCPRCGPWLLVPNLGSYPPFRLEDVLGDWDRRSIHRRSRLSHIVRCQQRNDGRMVDVPVHRLPDLRLDDPLPKLAEQMERLLLWLADQQPSYAERANLPGPEVAAWIGATILRGQPDSGFSWLVHAAEDRGLIEKIDSQGGTRLSLEGWTRVEALRKETSRSRTAFMALQFNDPDVEPILNALFRPAVERAGFELRTLEDGQGAGLIDDQLRVALRTARFVLADVTRGNQGAYWEAGFAEGLGRPVIYTCRKIEWDDPRKKPHFDTNHMLHIVWDPSDLTLASQKLTAAIRATLPEEAKMND